MFEHKIIRIGQLEGLHLAVQRLEENGAKVVQQAEEEVWITTKLRPFEVKKLISEIPGVHLGRSEEALDITVVADTILRQWGSDGAQKLIDRLRSSLEEA